MSRPHVVTPAELSALRDLELATRATVEGLRQGLHRSPFHGYSAEFSQYRHYRPGDDLKYVDWKALARTNKIYTRQFRETTNLNALFVVDVSRSMDFSAKFKLAQSIAAILGTLVLDQGDAAGMLAFDGRPTLVSPRSGHHHLRLMLAGIANLKPTGTHGVQHALKQAASVMKRRGLVVVISDLYEDEPALAEIRRLSRSGHDVVVVHTLSRGELSLSATGAAEFVDLESGQSLMVQPSSVRASYATAVQQWLTSIERTLQAEGIDYLRVLTDEPLEAVLRRFLIARQGRAR